MFASRLNPILARLLGGGSSEPHRVLGTYRVLRLRNAPSRTNQLGLIPGAPFRSWRRARAFVAQHGAEMQALYGVSRGTQLWRLFWAGLRYSVRPDGSAAYWALGQGRTPRWEGYLTDQHVNALFAAARAHLDVELRDLRDKRRFAGWAISHGLPAEPLIAEFSRDGGMLPRQVDLPRHDLFAKPADFFGGHGARRWQVADDGRWTDENGQQRSGEEILAELCEAAVERPHVLMRCLRPHPAVARITGSAVVCTVRCVTARGPAGEPLLVRSTLRLSVGKGVVDNRSSGGMLVAVDPVTGRFGEAVAPANQTLFTSIAAHPDTGVAFSGGEVPDWDAVRAAALAAQDAIHPLPMMAWDIGCTDAGPVILEANWGYAVDVITLAQGTTIEGTPLPAILLDLLRTNGL